MGNSKVSIEKQARKRRSRATGASKSKLRAIFEYEGVTRGEARTKHALRESERKLRVIFDSVAAGITITDLEGNIVEMNSGALRLHGFSDREEVIGRSGLELIAERDRPRALENWRKKLEGQDTKETSEHYTLLKADGAEFAAAVSEAVLRDEHGEPEGFVSIARDITDRKRMEEELRDSEEKLRLMFGSIEEGITVVDLEGKILEVNDVVCRATGRNRKELIGSNGFELMPPEYRDEIVNNLLKQIKGKVPKKAPIFKFSTPDGGEYYAELHVSVLRDSAGKPRGFVTITNDVTQQKRMQEELQQSEERRGVVFESITEGITVTDLEGRITDMNEAALRMHAFSDKGEVIGRNGVEIVAEKDRTRAVENMNKLLKEGHSEIEEYTLLDRDGNEFEAEWSAAMLRNGAGNISGFIGISRDITDRKRMQESILEEKDFSDAVINTLPGVFYLIDESGKFTRWNKNLERISGYSAKQIAKMNPLYLFVEEDRQMIAEKMQEVFDKGEATVEANTLTKKGDTIPFHLTGITITIGDSKYLAGLAIDITQRKQAEDALRDSEEKLRTMFSSIKDGIIVTDLTGAIVDINEAALQMHGYSDKSELIGRSGLDLITEESRAVAIEATVQALKENREALMVYKLLKKDGSRADGEGVSTVLRDASGNPVGMIVTTRDISERKRAEEALRDSEEKLRTMFESIEEAITVTDLEGKIVDANETAWRQGGFKSKEDMLGFNGFELVSEEDRQRIMEHTITAVKENRSTGLMVCDFTTLSGTKFLAELQISALRDSAGNPVGFIAASRDVTERKRMEEELRESEESYRTLFESSIDGVVVVDAETQKIELANRTALEIFGFDPEEEIPDVNLLDYVHPDDRERAITALAEDMFEKDTRQVKEFRTLTRDGREIWISALGVLFTYQGKLAALVTFRDVTETKQAVESLRNSEEKLRAMFESTSDGIVVTDLQLKIMEVNEAATRIFGRSREELIGSTALEFMSTDTSKEDEDIDEEKAATEFSVSQLRDTSGNITGFIGIARDITERRRAERKLKKAVEDLRISNEELQQFAYVASHDLQEPLRMVSSYTQLLERRYKGKLDADADEFIEYAVDGSNRMQAMIQALLTYSRVGTRGKAFEPTDLEAVFDKVLANLKVAIEESNAEVTHDPLPNIMADDIQMTQLLQNLVGNGLKFHEENQIPKVHVSAEEHKDDWLLSVRDNGIGIDPQYQERVFVIFQRLHGKQEYKGTGIGLAVCKRIVERHGGRIWVESEPGKGATFHFTISKIREEDENE